MRTIDWNLEVASDIIEQNNIQFVDRLADSGESKKSWNEIGLVSTEPRGITLKAYFKDKGS